MDITQAWKAADDTCFSKGLEALGGKEGQTAYRGFLPGTIRAWSFSSGGLATGPITRLRGTNPNWCNLSVQAEISYEAATYQQCLVFGGKILGWLQQTNNLHEVGNVMWLFLVDLPNRPVPEPLDDETGRMLWRLDTPLELVFSTAVEFPPA